MTSSTESRLWLAIVLPEPSVIESARGYGRIRRLRDRLAASRARRLALHAASLPMSTLTVSVSHSDGAGMAAIVLRPGRIGADIMRAARVGRRHALSIASSSELEMLEQPAEVIAPALAWTIKEAVYKATSKPLQQSIGTSTIVSCDTSAAVVRCSRPTENCFHVRWIVRGGFVASWALAVEG